MNRLGEVIVPKKVAKEPTTSIVPIRPVTLQSKLNGLGLFREKEVRVNGQVISY